MEMITDTSVLRLEDSGDSDTSEKIGAKDKEVTG